MLIKGSLPGSNGSRVILKPSRGVEIDFSFNDQVIKTESQVETEPQAENENQKGTKEFEEIKNKEE